MPRLSSAALILTILLIAPAPETGAQERGTPRVSTASSAKVKKERDGLLGPVRRVRIEVANLLLKAGELVEGPRKLLGSAVYDQNGDRIDDEYFPLQNSTHAGTEAYKYDDKGNVVEMTVRGADGSIVSQETYSYEFDAVGNWTKIVTSVAVLEGEKLSYEPSEVTYRTITYYRTDEVAKLLRSAAKTPAASADARAAGTAPASGRNQAGGSNHGAVNSTVAMRGPDSKPSAAPRRDVAAAKGGNTPAARPEAAKEVSAGEPIPVLTPVAAPFERVKGVSKEELRAAATFMPRPVYPTGAAIARVEGTVDVHVIVNEQGEVTAARAESGHPLLRAAAEQAARMARFSPAKLAAEPTKIDGVLSFQFKHDPSVVPQEAAALDSATRPKAQPVAGQAAASSSELTPLLARDTPAGLVGNAGAETRAGTSGAAEPGDARRPTPPAAGGAGENVRRAKGAAALAQEGRAYYEARQYKKAVVVFQHALDMTPESAVLHSNLGATYLAMGKHKDAVESFKKALALNPELTEAHVGLGMSHYGQRRYKDAVKAFEKALGVKQDLAAAHYGLGLAFNAQGNRSQAEQEHRILSKLDPKLAEELSRAIRPEGRFEFHGNVFPQGTERRQRP